MLNILTAIAASYIVGSIPTSIIAGRLRRGLDIREHGSGNAGATNVFRVLGWKAGMLVALFDLAKGFLAGGVIPRIDGMPDWLGPYTGPASLIPILCACFAILGHMFPVFAGFQGGKGVATGAGALFALHPAAASTCLLVFSIILVSSGYVSLGSICAAITLPVCTILLRAAIGTPLDPVWTVFTLAVAGLIVFMHRRNISRLIAGTENRFEKLRIFARKKG